MEFTLKCFANHFKGLHPIIRPFIRNSLLHNIAVRTIVYKEHTALTLLTFSLCKMDPQEEDVQPFETKI